MRSDTHTGSAVTVQVRTPTWRRIVPGVLVCLAVAGAAYGLSRFLPSVSPLIIAIVAGVVATNVLPIPRMLAPGIDFSAKKLLRVGIVFLGLQLALGDIVSLGLPVLAVVVIIVAGGLIGTAFIGRIMRVPSHLTLLIACGFSICGAAAVAGAAGVTDPNDEAEEDTITAVALVVIFGTIMIAVIPSAASALGMSEAAAGMWAGGSIHEIAQVVAAGGIIGTGALTMAVIVKLARVLLLAPVIATLSIRQRRASRTAGEEAVRGKLPPIVPPFIIGFLAMVLVRSFITLPDVVVSAGSIVQTVLLAAAMFGLGLGVKVKTLRKVGFRPFLLAAASTVLVAGLAWAGIAIAT